MSLAYQCAVDSLQIGISPEVVSSWNGWHRLDECLLENKFLSNHTSSSANYSRKGHELQLSKCQYAFRQFL
jgi:hypothetical protein